MATFSKFNAGFSNMANGVVNLGSDTLKCALSDTLPTAANAVLADITQIAAGNGYSSGGTTIGITSSTQSGGLWKLITSASTVFTASGGSIGPFRYAVIYDSTPAGGKLIGWVDIGAEYTILASNTFTLIWDTSNGLLQGS